MERQYPNYPYPPQPRPQPQPQTEERSDNKKLLIIIGVVVLVILILGFFAVKIFKKPSVPEHVCGDGKCEVNENCYNCAADCKCKANEYCSEVKGCSVPTCGNGKCEPFESSENCCDDCSCGIPQETCNTGTHVCKLPHIGVSDERVLELARKYFEDQGQVIATISEVRLYVYQDKPCKAVEITLEGEEDRMHLIAVTENEEVIEVPIF